jgi:RNA-directed DNA polymerase
MSFYNFVQERGSWLEFLAQEEQKEFKDERLVRQIGRLVENESYKTFDKEFFDNFAIPVVKRIGSYNTSKKRIVYVYPKKHRLALKLMAFYILKNYNHKFAKNSIAYTKGKSVRSAFRLLKSYRLSSKDTIYKNDFSDYFNSIDIDLLEPKLKAFLGDDMDLSELILRLLRNDKVIDNKKEISELHKGVMAGSPISGILANIFVDDIDKLMYKRRFKYIRYADDTLIVGRKALDFFISHIEKRGIKFNPKKMQVFNIKTGITFLGFKHIGNTIDISDEAKAKMKSRFKRRAKWYRQWAKRRNVKPEVAVKDYIKKINYKLFSDQDDSINWSRWYLPNINTAESLQYLDDYFIRAIRYLYTGEWSENKKHHSLSYNKIKELGYISLVDTYYKINK